MTTLGELISQAERESKWLFCNYQSLWFTPEELRAANADGRFRWGSMNFILRDPSERIKQLDQKVIEAEQAAKAAREKLSPEGEQWK